MKIIPVEDKVILKIEKAEEKTQSGLFLTGANKEDSTIGEVVAVGPGGLCGGKEVKMTVAVGQKVVVTESTPIRVGGENYAVVTMDQIIAVVE